MSEGQEITFEDKLRQAIQSNVLKSLAAGEWSKPDYNNRLTIPADLVKQAWELVDVEEIKTQLARRIERELADKLVNHMAAEMATDIKTILSDKDKREALRAIARSHVAEVCLIGGKASK